MEEFCKELQSRLPESKFRRVLQLVKDIQIKKVDPDQGTEEFLNMLRPYQDLYERSLFFFSAPFSVFGNIPRSARTARSLVPNYKLPSCIRDPDREREHQAVKIKTEKKRKRETDYGPSYRLKNKRGRFEKDEIINTSLVCGGRDRENKTCSKVPNAVETCEDELHYIDIRIELLRLVIGKIHMCLEKGNTAKEEHDELLSKLAIVLNCESKKDVQLDLSTMEASCVALEKLLQWLVNERDKSVAKWRTIHRGSSKDCTSYPLYLRRNLSSARNKDARRAYVENRLEWKVTDGGLLRPLRCTEDVFCKRRLKRQNPVTLL